MKLRILAVAVLSSLGLSTLIDGEGMRTEAYLDGAGVPTICVGHTKGVKMGMKVTEYECEVFLRQDLAWSEAAVRRLVKVPVTQHQYDALVLFVFNVGEAQFANSTLLRKLNSGDTAGALAEFPKWNKIRNPKTGKLEPSRGLSNRRRMEMNLFIKESK